MKIHIGSRAILTIGMAAFFSASFSPAYAQSSYFDEYLAVLDRTCDNGNFISCIEGVSLHSDGLIDKDKFLRFLSQACALEEDEICDSLPSTSASETPGIDRENFEIHVSDRDAQPLVRIPPAMPTRFLSGENSGYCKAKFDVSPEGQPFKVMTTYCTNTQLSRATVRSIQKWKYNPKIVNGQPVSRSGVETKVTFELQDEYGKVLPYPDE